MKRIIGVITVIVTLLMITNVYADNYKMRELIPHDKKITIRGDNILYKDIEYKDGTITIGTIKNQSEDKRNIT